MQTVSFRYRTNLDNIKVSGRFSGNQSGTAECFYDLCLLLCKDRGFYYIWRYKYASYRRRNNYKSSYGTGR